MTLAELEQALNRAGTGSEWVGLISRYFDLHDLNFGHGTDNSSDEAYWLVRHQQQWDDVAWDRPPDPALVPGLIALAQDRVTTRKPLAYLLGEAWFAGLRFVVDERVLIPRSPVAELIGRSFEPWCQLHKGDRILDLGTGSGCLAVATAHYCPDVTVDAVDVSKEAIDVARANIAAHGLAERVRPIQSDLFAAVEGRYRVIISNPPYVPEPRLAELPPEYAHEPCLALAGGPEGLSLVAEILLQAPRYLVADGVLIIEVGEAQEAFSTAYANLPVTWLEFEHGGEGVFLLTRDELTGYLAG
jgi:ribosomal protein L3 glutamine methyltransferase